jgi:hypothetical protein
MESQEKGKEQDHLKKTSLGPLRQGKWLDTSETKLCSSKEHKPPNQSSKTTKSSPYTHASSPWTNATTPGRMHAHHLMKTEQLHQLSSDRSDRYPTCKQDQHSDRSDRWPRPVRRWHTEPRNGSKPPENLPNAFSKPIQAQTSPPCWQCMNQAKNAKMQPRASQIDKIQHRMLHMPKWAS